jgi:hypothetical protein
MRKTTDPREHKYLADREFNSFGRGAIEDAPGELLYGHGALALGYNVNCYQRYFEGRGGSRALSRYRPPASLWHGSGKRWRVETSGGYEDAMVPSEEMPSTEGVRYVDWYSALGKGNTAHPEEAIFRDVLTGTNRGGELVVASGNEAWNNGEEMHAILRGKPVLMVWHNQLSLWVRIESGYLSFSEWDISLPDTSRDNIRWAGWQTVISLDGRFADSRTSFVEERNGGIIYNGSGIFRWNFDTNEVYRINADCPVYVRSTSRASPSAHEHTYRYLLTAVRLRGGISRLDGGIVDYESSVSEHGFLLSNTTLEDPQRAGLLTVEYPIESTDTDGKNPLRVAIRRNPKTDVTLGTITHIGVYRTLDLGEYDPVSDAIVNVNVARANRFALVADVPVGSANLDRPPHAEVLAFYDDVEDAVLRARMDDWYPRTRFHRPLPNCTVAAAVPGFIVCAVDGESKLYCAQDTGFGWYTAGSHNPGLQPDAIQDAIRHIEVFPDVGVLFCNHSTWSFPIGVSEGMEEPGSLRWLAMISKISVVDALIGCVHPQTVRRLSHGEVILVTAENAAPAVRAFNGYAYGEDLLEDSGLGLSRNKNKLRQMYGAVALYGEATGYIVWCSFLVDGYPPRLGNLHASISSYCFRVAVRASQGGGVTEYGGERWLWPDAGDSEQPAASVAVGHEPGGKSIPIVEDARTGNFYRVGLSEQWLDREGDYVGARDEDGGYVFVLAPDYEIETRAALPIISDGYKWQKHLETHIAMRCWKSEYRGADGYTADGFRFGHKVGIKIYEDGEQLAESSALKDINRNGDYAYLKKVEARRLQDVIETSTSCYKISQVAAKVQTSDREALPADNVPVEIEYWREWRDAVVHLSRNLPYLSYNRATGIDVVVGVVEPADGPFGRVGEALCLAAGAFVVAEGVTVSGDFTVSMWVCAAPFDDFSVKIFSLRGSAISVSAPAEAMGKWAHVVVVCKDGGGPRVYVDGEITTDISMSAFSGTPVLGAEYSTAEVKIFDVRVIPSAVSVESMASYRESIERGGEGWLP